MAAKRKSSVAAPVETAKTTKLKNAKADQSLSLYRMSDPDMVDITVGPEKKLFRFHKYILCTKIGFFQKMFWGGFQEAIGNSASFPEDDERGFQILFQWVYTGKLPELEGNRETMTTGEHSHVAWEPISVYKLADKLCCMPFMDAIMSTLIRFHRFTNTLPSLRDVSQVYHDLPQGSAYRKYISMSLHYIIAEHHDESTMKIWPTRDIYELFKTQDDFSFDVLTLMREHIPHKGVKSPTSLPICTFHAHGEDYLCEDRA